MAIASNIEIRIVDPKSVSGEWSFFRERERFAIPTIFFADAQIQDATNVWIEAFKDSTITIHHTPHPRDPTIHKFRIPRHLLI